MATVDELKSVQAEVRRCFDVVADPSAAATDAVLTRMVGEAKRAEERRELEAFGEDVRLAAEAGWDALRGKNPKVDREDGAGNEIRVFEDLPHKVKLNYLTFAQGALSHSEIAPPPRPSIGELFTAPVGTDLPADPFAPAEGFQEFGTVESVEVSEPAEFKAGDKVKVTGPRIWGYRSISTRLDDGEVVTIDSGIIDDDGDILVIRDNGDSEWIRATSLTKIEDTSPAQLKEGDRVKITGPKKTTGGHSRENLLRYAQFGTVIAGTDEVGDARIQADTGLMAWIAASSLTKVEEPVFKPGDRVRIVGPCQTTGGVTQFVNGDYGTVVQYDYAGNVHLTDQRGVGCYLDPASLELANGAG